MEKRQATFTEAILGLFFMVFFVFVGYLVFGLRVELMMIAAASFAGILAYRLGYSWHDMEQAISNRITRATPAILIIWVIGIVIATLIFSGSIPMLIYYGIKIVNPDYVLISAFLICIVFSTVTGSSWASAGTAGVAFMGIATALDVPLYLTAAAIICGATFGDKLSPLSESTNLASACVGTNLYDHIKSLLWTTFPATLIAFFVFFIAGNNLNIESQGLSREALSLLVDLDNMFKWNIMLLIPFVVILLGSITKKPPVPTMLLSCLSAIIIGVAYQGFSLQDGVLSALRGFNSTMIPGITSENLSKSTLTLLNRGGMVSMVGVVIIIYCGYAYAAIMSKAGFIETAIRPLSSRVKNRGPVMIVALFASLILLVFSGTSYTVHIMIPEMFKKAFLKAGMGPLTLSRSIEDVGTMMAPLVPWGSSGAFYVSTLGVTIFGAGGYALWTVTAYITPIIAIIFAYTGIGIYKLSKEQIDEALVEYDNQQKAL
ncbi:Na+/H+ antiporter NhaC [Peribacillus sp. TH16]|uniref:Na+/H+ antiporter NhaC n=1 Tax=Peribacillus sp. TH16 TaxID=2798482 RepID=UPI0007002650|nr:Na+/H+ antiporter NhaC [Peribacillus sp. TH16]KQU25925.1 hypothetical protein ASG65_15095 [Bacillus sp. Leaf13]MBK5482719.1 Na+/H+ antiporter NhaC [Peribacillus sp. TH16]